jgi:hypothetical protein
MLLTGFCYVICGNFSLKKIMKAVTGLFGTLFFYVLREIIFFLFFLRHLSAKFFLDLESNLIFGYYLIYLISFFSFLGKLEN